MSKDPPVDYCSMLAHEMVVNHIRPVPGKIDKSFVRENGTPYGSLRECLEDRHQGFEIQKLFELTWETVLYEIIVNSLQPRMVFRGSGLLNRRVQAARCVTPYISRTRKRETGQCQIIGATRI